MKNKMPIPRPCKRCGGRFEPTGRTERICPKCCEEIK